jgi:hypothetical protein
MNGTARLELAEAGFSIQYKDGKLSVANHVNSVHGSGKPNELQIKTDDFTIAIAHTHGNKAKPEPSAFDRTSNRPNFVRSKLALYVTVPGTTRIIKLVPAPSR